MIAKILQTLVRKKTPIVFNDLLRTFPVSSTFGLDRGTPIDRYYIDAFLSCNSKHITGNVLEVAESNYSIKYGENVNKYLIINPVGVDDNTNVVGDLTNMSTLPAELIDCFICTQTFNFIYDLEKAVAGAYHLLKPGGVLLATVAGLCQVSRYDMDRWGDYWRFTTASVQRAFGQVFEENLDVRSYGNVLAACAILQGIAVEDLPNPTLLDDNDPDYQVVIAIIARKPS